MQIKSKLFIYIFLHIFTKNMDDQKAKSSQQFESYKKVKVIGKGSFGKAFLV